MKILHVNATDYGGAAKAAFNLMNALEKIGHSSVLCVGNRKSSDNRVIELDRDTNPLRFKMKRLFFNSIGLPDWRFRERTISLTDKKYFLDADIVHLHNIHGYYFDYRVLPFLAAKKPVVWSLHDMWALTGYCAYSYDCARWKKGCGKCPQYNDRKFREPPAVGMDMTGINWRQKKMAFKKAKPLLVVICEAYEKMCGESPITMNLDCRVIPNGLDTELFSPIEKQKARKELGLNHDNKILMSIPSPGRKGLDILSRIILKLENIGNLTVIVAGGYKLPYKSKNKIDLVYVDYIDNDRLLNLYYSAADLFLLPSRADNVPLTLSEAIISGTPCVTFNVGGISTVVPHLDCGYLAKPLDEDDFVNGIKLLLNDNELRLKCSRNARIHGVKNFDSMNSAKLYASLYEEAYKKFWKKKCE